MSRVWLTAAWTLGLVVGVGVSEGRAQAPTLEQRLTTHLDTLLPLLEEARAEALRAAAVRDSVRLAESVVALDTVLVGPIRVLAYPDQRSLAEEIVGTAWADLSGVVGRSPGLEGTTFFVDGVGRRPPAFVDQAVQVVSAPAWVRRSAVEGNTRSALGRALATDLGPNLRAWSGVWNVGPPLRTDRVYRELMTTASQANRACIEGDVGACASAMGLAGSGLSDWYAPEEAAALAVHLHTRWSREAWYRRDLRSLAAGQRCQEDAAAGRVESCREFLVGQGSRVPAPMGMAARQTLMWVALEKGGAGAWDRLTAEPGRTPEAALAAASGLTTPELMAAWRAWLDTRRPVTYSALPTTRWVSFFWFLFFSFLALRSSRWRSE